MNAESRVCIDLSDNEDLKDYFKGKQPGDEYSLLIKGKIVENGDQFVGDVDSVVEQGDDDEASEATPDDEEAEGDGPSGMAGLSPKTPDSAVAEMGPAVAKAMGKK